MSCRIKKTADNVRSLYNLGSVQIVAENSKGEGETRVCYTETEEYVSVPFMRGLPFAEPMPVITPNYEFEKQVSRKPLPHHVGLISEIIRILLASRAVLLHMDPGAGKTFMSCWVALAFGQPAIFASPTSVLPEQWYQDFLKIMPQFRNYARKCENVDDARSIAQSGSPPFFLFIRSHAIKELPQAMLDYYKVLTIDETHLQCSPMQSNGVFKIHPYYVIGCSGTPIRGDGQHAIMEACIGTEKIRYQRNKPGRVIIFNIGITTSDEEYERIGGYGSASDGGGSKKLDLYGRMLRAVSFHQLTIYRTARLITAEVNEGRRVLVISSYVLQCRMLAWMLNAFGGPNMATMYVGGQDVYNPRAPVILGTKGKVGTGFDQANGKTAFDGIRISTVFVMQSVKQWKDIWQFMGRAMRCEENMEPRMYNIVYGGIKVFLKHSDEMANEFVKEGCVVSTQQYSDKHYEIPTDEANRIADSYQNAAED